MYSLCSQFGLTYVINSQWFKLANENRKVLLFNLFVINLILSTFSIFLFLLLQNKLTPLLIGDVWLNFKELSLFIIIQIFSVGFKSLFDGYMIIEKKIKWILILSLLSIIINTITFMYLVIEYSDIYIIIKSQSLIVLLFGSIYSIIIINNSNFRFDISFWKKTLRIGYPVFIRSIFNFARNRYDSILAVNLLGGSNFAVYNFSKNVVSLNEYLAGAFDKSFSPYLYKKISEGSSNNRDFALLIYLYFTITVCGIYIFCICGKTLISFLTNNLFNESFDYILLLLIYVLFGIPTMCSGHILVSYEKTTWILWNTIFQFIILVSLSYFLYQPFGITGVLVSLCISNIIYSLNQYILSRKLFNLCIMERSLFLDTLLVLAGIMILYFHGSLLFISLVIVYIIYKLIKQFKDYKVTKDTI